MELPSTHHHHPMAVTTLPSNKDLPILLRLMVELLQALDISNLLIRIMDCQPGVPISSLKTSIGLKDLSSNLTIVATITKEATITRGGVETHEEVVISKDLSISKEVTRGMLMTSAT